MLTQSTWEALLGIFTVFWTGLDVIFNGISNLFASIFDAIPVTALPFLIGLFCYALVDFLTYFTSLQDEGVKAVAMRVITTITTIIVFLFAVWRLGIVDSLSFELSLSTMSEIFISIVYIMFGVILVYTIYSDNGKMIRIALQAILWFLLLLVTFVTAPVFEGFEPTFETLTQVLICAVLFGIPKILNKYNKEREEATEDEKK